MFGAIVVLGLSGCASSYNAPIDLKGSGVGVAVARLENDPLGPEELSTLYHFLQFAYDGGLRNTVALREVRRDFEAHAAKVYANVGRAFSDAMRDTESIANPPDKKLVEQWRAYVARSESGKAGDPTEDARLFYRLAQESFSLRAQWVAKMNPQWQWRYMQRWDPSWGLAATTPAASAGSSSDSLPREMTLEQRQQWFQEVAASFQPLSSRFGAAWRAGKPQGIVPNEESVSKWEKLKANIETTSGSVDEVVSLYSGVLREVLRLEAAVGKN